MKFHSKCDVKQTIHYTREYKEENENIFVFTRSLSCCERQKKNNNK